MSKQETVIATDVDNPTIDVDKSAIEVDSAHRHSPFAAVYERNYLLLLIGNGVAHAADQMEFVARGWLVLELTNSPLALGLVAFSGGVPRLFLALFAGVMADRFDRRRLLFLCTAVKLLNSLIFGTLVLTGLVELWHVLTIVVVTSVFSTLNFVTREAMLPDTVSRRNIANAVALHSTVRGTTQVVAQSVAGLLVALIGVAGVLYVNAFGYVTMLVALALMRLAPALAPTQRLGFRQDLGRGLLYVWNARDLLAVILLALVPIVLIQPYRTLMPIFARDVLDVGSAGYGLLMAAPGIGSLVAAVAMTALNPQRRGMLMLTSLLALSATVAAFAVSTSFAPAMVALALVGLAFNVYRIMNNTVLQLLTPRELMGRVMGVYHMDRGVMPLGSLALGWMATLAGAPFAVTLAAGLCALFSAAILVLRPSLRRL